MSEKTYQIAVTGQLVPGAELSQVQAGLAKLFNASAEKLAPLFSGKRIVIKQGLDEGTARKYVAAVQVAGMVCLMEAIGGAPASPAPTSSPQPAAAPAAAGGGVTLAPVGATLVEKPHVAPPQIDISKLSMAAMGGNLVEVMPTPEFDIDISHLTAAPPGERLVEAPVVAPPKIDISHLTAAPPGERLAETPVVAPPNIDTSAMNLAPVGSDVGEQRRTDFPPPPKTDHLKLE